MDGELTHLGRRLLLGLRIAKVDLVHQAREQEYAGVLAIEVDQLIELGHARALVLLLQAAHEKFNLDWSGDAPGQVRRENEDAGAARSHTPRAAFEFAFYKSKAGGWGRMGLAAGAAGGTRRAATRTCANRGLPNIFADADAPTTDSVHN